MNMKMVECESESDLKLQLKGYNPGSIYWNGFFSKFFDTLFSVKLWIMIGVLSLSTYLLLLKLIGSYEWTIINTVVVSIVIVVREFNHITKIKEYTKSSNKSIQEINCKL